MKIQIGPTCKDCFCGVCNGFGGLFCAQHLHRYNGEDPVAVPGPKCPAVISERVALSLVREGGENEAVSKSENKGVGLIAAERRRQVEEEGYSLEHDLDHMNGELAEAGAYYAWPGDVLMASGEIKIEARLLASLGWLLSEKV